MYASISCESSWMQLLCLSLYYVDIVLLACFFFFNDTATTEIYTLSLHDALPISTADRSMGRHRSPGPCSEWRCSTGDCAPCGSSRGGACARRPPARRAPSRRKSIGTAALDRRR